MAGEEITIIVDAYVFFVRQPCGGPNSSGQPGGRPPEILAQLGVNANIPLMNLILQLEGNRIGTLALYADGLS